MFEVKPFDPQWKRTFEMLKTVLQGEVVEIEHVGSTAVEGLAAKPIIDIDVVIPDESRLPDVIIQLRAISYEYEGP